MTSISADLPVLLPERDATSEPKPMEATEGSDPRPHVARWKLPSRHLPPILGGLFAVHLLLPQVGQLGATATALRHVSWSWLAPITAATAFTYFMAAVSLRGASARHLPIGRTMAAQLAAAFTNRMAPAGLGGMRTNVRYLEKGGSSRPAAVAAVGLNSVAGFVVHVIGILAIVPLLGASRTRFHFSGPDLPDHWGLLVLTVGVLAAAGLVSWEMRLHHRLALPVRTAAAALAYEARHPRTALATFGGSAGITLGYALALSASLHAFGVGLAVPAVLAIFLGGSAVASVAPTPGGLGALEAALVAGLTSAGVASGPAIAGVLTYRLVTYWLPVLPGAFAYRSLRRKGSL